MLEKSTTKALEKVGIKVGTKTSRNGLLELLQKHITKKRTRISSPAPAQTILTKHIKKKQTRISSPAQTIQDNMVVDAERSEIDIDFSTLELPDLVKMVSGVGLDSRRMDKAELIKKLQNISGLGLVSLMASSF